jgi:hypothetical protein
MEAAWLSNAHATVSTILICIACAVALLTPPLICILYVQLGRKNGSLVETEGKVLETSTFEMEEREGGRQQGVAYIKEKKKVTFKRGRGKGSRKASPHC